MREMKGVLPKGMVEEVDEFIHSRECVSLGCVERLGKEKLGFVWKIEGFRNELGGFGG